LEIELQACDFAMRHETETLLEWLEQELSLRGWSDRRLAREAHISPTAMTRLRQGITPGLEVCAKIARAVDEPLEAILKMAGLLPVQSSKDSPKRDKWNTLIDELTDEQIERFTEVIELLKKQEQDSKLNRRGR
jgi:transcriptional regulator with XRE-family HTH domain